MGTRSSSAVGSNPLLEAALAYARRGWPVFPLAPGRKTPLLPKAAGGEGFKDATREEAQIRRWWGGHPTANIGLRTGAASGVDVLDPDEKDGRHGRKTIADLEADHGGVETLTAVTPTNGLHMYFQHADGLRCGADVLPGCDLRAEGGYVVAPPSVVRGKLYRWLEGQDPLRTPIVAWPRWLLELVRTPQRGHPPTIAVVQAGNESGTAYGLAALAREVAMASTAAEGTRNDRLNRAAFACGQLLAGGELLDEALVRSALASAGAETGLGGAETLATIESGIRAGSACPRRSSSVVVSSDHGGFGTGTTVAVARDRTWKPFPIDVLPPACRALVADGARAMGIDTAFIAVPMLGALAGAIGNTRIVRVKRTYSEPMVLWTCTVAGSGSMKSPPLDLVLAPLKSRDRELLRLNEGLREAYQTRLAIYERDRKAFMGKSGKGGSPPSSPQESPALATLVDDITVESLVKRLVDNPRGLLLAVDELSSLFGSMDAYKRSKGGDVPKYLTMHRAGSLKSDRKGGSDRRGGGTLYVPRAALSILGTIQPRTLRRLLTEEYLANGFSARLFFAMPPSEPPRWTEDDVDESVLLRYSTVVQALLGLAMSSSGDGADASPQELLLDADAARLWPAIHDRHADRMRGASDDLGAAFSKLRGGIIRVAGLLALTRGAERGDAAEVGEITGDDLTGGERIATWFEDEAERLYAMLGETEEETLIHRDVDLVRALGGSVSPRDLSHASARTYRDKPQEAKLALDRLVEAGRGEWRESAPGGRGGRPTRRFHLHAHDVTGGAGTETPSEAGPECAQNDGQDTRSDASTASEEGGGFGTTQGLSAPPKSARAVDSGGAEPSAP